LGVVCRLKLKYQRHKAGGLILRWRECADETSALPVSRWRSV
jgi:hypothetical protein